MADPSRTRIELEREGNLATDGIARGSARPGAGSQASSCFEDDRNSRGTPRPRRIRRKGMLYFQRRLQRWGDIQVAREAAGAAETWCSLPRYRSSEKDAPWIRC